MTNLYTFTILWFNVYDFVDKNEKQPSSVVPVETPGFVYFIEPSDFFIELHFSSYFFVSEMALDFI